jgi:hypothetical protein
MPTVRLTEVYTNNSFTSGDKKYELRQLYVNPDFVVSLREDNSTTVSLLNESLTEKLEGGHRFTKLRLSGQGSMSSDIVVVGSPDVIESKLSAPATKDILRG